ncbi:MAG TPA: hypothetical protein VLM75_08865 [Spirochaetota bacterium]|nr:hypothetical protein [Spirochaetota bacterium]
MLIVSEDGARAGDTLYLSGAIGGPCLSEEASSALLRGIVQMFAPHALADTAGGILAAVREVADHTGLGFLIIEESLPLADGLAVPVYAARGGYLFSSPSRPVTTMSITIDGVRVSPVGELAVTGETVLRNGKTIDVERDERGLYDP